MSLPRSIQPHDPGVARELVWGLPWRGNVQFPGLAYCTGGKSLFWGGWCPRLTPGDLAGWPSRSRPISTPTIPRSRARLASSRARTSSWRSVHRAPRRSRAAAAQWRISKRVWAKAASSRRRSPCRATHRLRAFSASTSSAACRCWSKPSARRPRLPASMIRSGVCSSYRSHTPSSCIRRAASSTRWR